MKRRMRIMATKAATWHRTRFWMRLYLVFSIQIVTRLMLTIRLGIMPCPRRLLILVWEKSQDAISWRMQRTAFLPHAPPLLATQRCSNALSRKRYTIRELDLLQASSIQYCTDRHPDPRNPSRRMGVTNQNPALRSSFTCLAYAQP